MEKLLKQIVSHKDDTIIVLVQELIRWGLNKSGWIFFRTKLRKVKR